MTDQERAEVEAIEQRAENATPGPWERGTGGKFLNTVAARTIRGIAKNVCQVGGYFRGARDFNATFISAARTDIPRLILMLRAESEAREAAERTLSAREIQYDALCKSVKASGERTGKAEQELAALRTRESRLVDALGMMYDKWENGIPCYDDPEDCSGSNGNAFKLNELEEREVLSLIPQYPAPPESEGGK